MPSAPNTLHVFLSSTSEDLEPYRRVAMEVIRKEEWLPVPMEDFGSMPEPTVEACRRKLDQCQLVLLLQAFRRGWVPTLEQGGNGVDSMTALELAYANSKGIPVLALLAGDDWPGKLWEHVALDWVLKFRSSLNRPVAFFDHEDESVAEDRRLPLFRTKVAKALRDYKDRLLAQQQQESSAAGGSPDFFGNAREALVKGRAVPFLGPGIFGDGPLGLKTLTLALAESEDPDPTHCLATVAEYCERKEGYRGDFLERLYETVARQMAQAQEPPVLELLLRVKAPALLVAATYDQMLEQRLRREQRRFAVVAHVLHSDGNEHDGKILVVRDGAAPTLSPADKVELQPDEWVIYRPLGSPLLNNALPDLGIDTVVITETDHLTFLGRLENQHTKIPTAFSRPLQTRPLLFMGYGLDVWHFRLVMQVFKLVGENKRLVAVREPATVMERLSWQRLGADLVPDDPNRFATRVLATLDHDDARPQPQS